MPKLIEQIRMFELALIEARERARKLNCSQRVLIGHLSEFGLQEVEEAKRNF